MQTIDYIIRVSKMGSRTEGDESTMTIEDQRRQCEQVIRDRGFRVGREHKALNQSGSTSVDSKHFRAALTRIRRGESAGLAVAYDDRLARDWRKLGRFYDELEELDAELIIANLPGVDYRTSQGRMQTGLVGIVSEQKYQVAKTRGNAIADRTVERGVANRVSFGYRRNGSYVDGKLAAKVRDDLDGKALVPDAETAPLLRGIFERRADGHPWVEIGRWLESEGATPPRGGQWAVSTLRNIIANETYLGVVTLGERRLKDAHEPLVTRAQWKAAQSIKSVQRTGRNAAGLAGGLLVCSTCRGRLSVTGSDNPSYTCRRTMGGRPCERPTYVSKRRADEWVERQVTEMIELGTLDVVAASNDLERLREEKAAAQAELESYVVAASARDKRLFNLGLDAREKKAEATRSALDDAIEQAEDGGIPDASGWAALKKNEDLDGMRRVARRMLVEVVVAPPETSSDRGPHANVDQRFTPRWQGR
jgi:DNA invertase Pin-like site-specific DNA recombinase